MNVIGIDPGLEGAIAFIGSHDAQVWDMPVAGAGKTRTVSGRLVAETLFGLRIDAAVVESVHAMPKQGVSSSFRFGMAYGTVLGAIQALSIPIIHVTPAKWKAHFRLRADKEMARQRAIELFPSCAARLTRKKDADRAEALLIARWYLDLNKMNQGRSDFQGGEAGGAP
jgi:crossover junction endodeoxyribonuclease RuvC